MTEEAERFATPRVAAGALFVDDEGRVLLLHPTYKDTWDIPGGYVERGESPASACEREVHEEIGLRRTANRLLAVDWAPHKKEGDKLLFIFDCGVIGEDETNIRLNEREVDLWQWTRADDLTSVLNGRLAPRIRTALANRSNGAVYLEYGAMTR
ncbi:MAG: NUDIX domain-containing protein [Pseudonocardia sp.]